MTNILIPTDFKATSLSIAENAVRTLAVEKCNIILFHVFALPSSPFDLLGNGAKDPAYDLMSESFRIACKQLKDNYAKKISKINLKCMKGDSIMLFKNFIDANDVDLIYCPDDFIFSKVHPQSVNPLPLFNKSGIPVVKETASRQKAAQPATVLQYMQVSTS